MILILMGCIESGANVIYLYIYTQSINLFTNLIGLIMMMVMMMMMIMTNMVTSDERESNQEKRDDSKNMQ